MDAADSLWAGRRVLVTGCDQFLGAAVTRELLGRGATIVGVISDRARGAEYRRDIAAGRFHLFQANYRDASRLHTAMAVHEVCAVFHLADTEPTPVLRAASLYHSAVPVISTRTPSRWSFAGGESARTPLSGVIRFEELFGPGDRDTNHLVARTLLALLGGETPLPALGGSRDYVFVRDAARACLELAEEVARAGRCLEWTARSGWVFTDAQMTKVLANAVAGIPPASHSAEFQEAIAETVAWYRQVATSMASSNPVRRAA
jgi:nucleoside-diphosphate-sugar epimerase